MMRSLIFAITCSGLACSASVGAQKDSGAGPQDGASAQSCTYTLSGAISATGSCTATAAFDTSSGTNPGLGFDITGTSAEFNFGSNLSASNDFAALETYDQTNVVNAAAEVLQGNPPLTWEATVHNTNGDPDQGSFSLHITDTGTTLTSNGNSVWTAPHGSLDATLPAVTASGASGTVTAHVTF